MATSSMALVKEFFGDVRPVTVAELKELPNAERIELSDAIAEQRGMVGSTRPDGVREYTQKAA